MCYTANRIQVLLKEQNHYTKTILALVFCDNLRVSELKSWTHCSSQLHNTTFNHPAKSMDDGNMLLFLHGVLQVYLGFWNATNPIQEYIPDFTTASRCLQDECANMITETVSLLKHIRSCQYLANINTVEKMDELQKLNTDLISILSKYFQTNIWA